MAKRASSEENEVAQRMERALKRSLEMPPKPHKKVAKQKTPPQSKGGVTGDKSKA